MSVTLDDFNELDLRIGTVQNVRDHPNADTLYVIDVDLGELDNRQLVAGLVDHYDPGELEGRQVVVITNLEPATIRGETSEGMLLAADAERHVSVLGPDRAVPNGTTVR